MSNRIRGIPKWPFLNVATRRKGAKRPNHTTNIIISSDNDPKINAEMEFFDAMNR